MLGMDSAISFQNKYLSTWVVFEWYNFEEQCVQLISSFAYTRFRWRYPVDCWMVAKENKYSTIEGEFIFSQVNNKNPGNKDQLELLSSQSLLSFI